MHRSRLRVEASAFFAGAVALLLLPLPWFLAFVFAAAFHELGHLTAVFLTGGDVLEITIGAAGARIVTSPQTEGRNLLCALAGPAVSFLLLLLVHITPRISICGFLQGSYNLLPFPAMDGGRILKSLYWLRKIPCKVGEHTVQ